MTTPNSFTIRARDDLGNDRPGKVHGEHMTLADVLAWIDTSAEQEGTFEVIREADGLPECGYLCEMCGGAQACECGRPECPDTEHDLGDPLLPDEREPARCAAPVDPLSEGAERDEIVAAFARAFGRQPDHEDWEGGTAALASHVWAQHEIDPVLCGREATEERTVEDVVVHLCAEHAAALAASLN